MLQRRDMRAYDMRDMRSGAQRAFAKMRVAGAAAVAMFHVDRATLPRTAAMRLFTFTMLPCRLCRDAAMFCASRRFCLRYDVCHAIVCCHCLHATLVLPARVDIMSPYATSPAAPCRLIPRAGHAMP